VNFLLDTNIISESVRPRPDSGVMRWLAEADEDALYLSVLSLAEISHGVEKIPEGPRKQALEEWLRESLPERFESRLLPVDREVSLSWGALMIRAARKGITLGVVDGFFAATAFVFDLTLVTRNVRRFERLEIQLLNPWKSGT
jgi:toxin FitB